MSTMTSTDRDGDAEGVDGCRRAKDGLERIAALTHQS
jgi:hypothetical protein